MDNLCSISGNAHNHHDFLWDGFAVAFILYIPFRHTMNLQKIVFELIDSPSSHRSAIGVHSNQIPLANLMTSAISCTENQFL